MKWLLDVNITKGIESFLKKEGENVVSLISLGLRHLKNGSVLRKAKELDRILLSFDRDFIKLARGEHPGIVVIKIHPNTDDKIIPILENFKNQLDINKVRNHLIIIETSKIIYRKSDK